MRYFHSQRLIGPRSNSCHVCPVFCETHFIGAARSASINAQQPMVAGTVFIEMNDTSRSRLFTSEVWFQGVEAAAGGNIAVIHEGDSITIDARQLVLQLNVSDEVLAQRKVGWKAPLPRYTRGVQAKFAFNASSASKGAVLDDY